MEALPSRQPGYFQIVIGAGGSGWYFECNCPCGCPYLDCVPIQLEGETDREERAKRNPEFVFWKWDGNLSHPTLTPSLRRNVPCKIHFNVTAGRYHNHGDGAPNAPDCYAAP